MQAAMPDDDPLALEDPFTQLSEAELAQDWSHRAEPLEEAPGRSGLEFTAGGNMLHEHPPTLSERLGGLSQLRETTYVDVQLVGLDGQGQLGAHVSPSAMQRLLEAIPHDEPVRVLHPTPGASHELPITRRFLYQAPAHLLIGMDLHNLPRNRPGNSDRFGAHVDAHNQPRSHTNLSCRPLPS